MARKLRLGRIATHLGHRLGTNVRFLMGTNSEATEQQYRHQFTLSNRSFLTKTTQSPAPVVSVAP